MKLNEFIKPMLKNDSKCCICIYKKGGCLILCKACDLKKHLTDEIKNYYVVDCNFSNNAYVILVSKDYKSIEEFAITKKKINDRRKKINKLLKL